MAAHSVIGGIGVLALVIVATMLSVMFATRGAMATNRPIIEVLHFVGAKDDFIAAQFQRHFLQLGLKGGAIGGGGAMALFVLAELSCRLGLAGSAGGRPDRGPVRHSLDRGAGLCRDPRPDRADRRWSPPQPLAHDGQPHDR